MLSTVATRRLPCSSAASAARGAAVAPFPAHLVPTRSLLARAGKDQSQPEGKQQQQQQSESPLQPQGSQQGSELAAMPFGGDLMDLRTVMPTPFRRMADHMLQMQREMDALMGAFGAPSMLSADPFALDVFDRAAAAPLLARRAGLGALGRVVPLDVAEDDKGYTVTAEVPGFDKNEIKVSLSEDGVLTMTGSHEETSAAEPPAAGKETTAAEKGGVKGGARRYASFVRSVQLPDNADVGAVTATTQHGVLTVRIPKTEKPAPKVREIPVA